MPTKQKLDLDGLSVESFETTGAPDDVRGTVRAHESGDAPDPTPPEYACTCANTCLCKTAYYHCGTGHFSIYSCDYTANPSCLVTA
jgi:hypothetical protein